MTTGPFIVGQILYLSKMVHQIPIGTTRVCTSKSLLVILEVVDMWHKRLLRDVAAFGICRLTSSVRPTFPKLLL